MLFYVGFLILRCCSICEGTPVTGRYLSQNLKRNPFKNFLWIGQLLSNLFVWLISVWLSPWTSLVIDGSVVIGCTVTHYVTMLLVSFMSLLFEMIFGTHADCLIQQRSCLMICVSYGKCIQQEVFPSPYYCNVQGCIFMIIMVNTCFFIWNTYRLKESLYRTPRLIYIRPSPARKIVGPARLILAQPVEQV